jgi:hypothetical protein
MNLVLKLISSPWFWLDVALSISGGIFVWRGLVIEKRAEKLLPPENFKPDIFADIVDQYRSEIERGWHILMRGIIIEVVAALGISVISGLEIANLTDKSAAANKEAGAAMVYAANSSSNSVALSKQVAGLNKEAADARITAGNAEKEAGQLKERAAKLDEARVMVEKDVAELRKEASDSKLFAAQIGTTNAQLIATNLLVEKQVEELHKENLLLAARTIMQSQLEIFTNILKGVLKFPVRIFVPDANEGFETENFSLQIRELLDAAGYGRGKNEGIEKERLNRNFPIGTSDNNQLYFIFYGKQNEGINWPSLKIKTEGNKVTTTSTFSPTGKNDLSAVPGQIYLAFIEIGIAPGIWVGEYRDFLKPGEWGIFIPQKL